MLKTTELEDEPSPTLTGTDPQKQTGRQLCLVRLGDQPCEQPVQTSRANRQPSLEHTPEVAGVLLALAGKDKPAQAGLGLEVGAQAGARETARYLETSWKPVGNQWKLAMISAARMDGAVVVDRHQGGARLAAISPLLATVLVDDMDKALEACTCCFTRSADDGQVHAGSKKAGERVMAYVG